MGFLNQAGAAIGQAFAPSATAGGLAADALGYGTLATGVNVGSQLIAGIGGLEQANYAAKVSGANATAALEAGQEAGSASKMRYSKLEATQVADQAANGIQVREGSAARTVEATENIGAMDAALIHYNAARQAYAETTQAGLYKAAGKGAVEKSVLGAGASFLSSAQSLSDKWLLYKLSGALHA